MVVNANSVCLITDPIGSVQKPQETSFVTRLVCFQTNESFDCSTVLSVTNCLLKEASVGLILNQVKPHTKPGLTFPRFCIKLVCSKYGFT